MKNKKGKEEDNIECIIDTFATPDIDSIVNSFPVKRKKNIKKYAGASLLATLIALGVTLEIKDSQSQNLSEDIAQRSDLLQSFENNINLKEEDTIRIYPIKVVENGQIVYYVPYGYRLVYEDGIYYAEKKTVFYESEYSSEFDYTLPKLKLQKKN